MIASLRKFGAVGVMWYMAGTAMATPTTIDTSSTNYPGWNEKSTLPSATAAVPFMKDSAVRLASDDQDAKSEEKSDSNCNTCQGDSNSCGCGNVNYCCCPSWYVDAGAVILIRNRAERDPIMTQASNNRPIVSGHDSRFGWNGDPDITIGYRMNCCDAWEARYFGDTGADANASVGFGSPISMIIADGTPAVLTYSVDYRTDLHSFELNERHSVTEGVTFITGFRYLEVDEDLTFDIVDNANHSIQYAWSDGNHLYGGQIGTDLALWCGGPLQFNTIVKGGIYGDAADNAYRNRQVSGNVVRNGASDGDVAFVGEIDALFTYRICCNVALRGGYQLLWIDGVALASDNAASTNPTNHGAVIDTNGDLFYHGATVALEFVW